MHGAEPKYLSIFGNLARMNSRTIFAYTTNRGRGYFRPMRMGDCSPIGTRGATLRFNRNRKQSPCVLDLEIGIASTPPTARGWVAKEKAVIVFLKLRMSAITTE